MAPHNLDRTPPPASPTTDAMATDNLAAAAASAAAAGGAVIVTRSILVPACVGDSDVRPRVAIPFRAYSETTVGTDVTTTTVSSLSGGCLTSMSFAGLSPRMSAVQAPLLYPPTVAGTGQWAHGLPVTSGIPYSHPSHAYMQYYNPFGLTHPALAGLPIASCDGTAANPSLATGVSPSVLPVSVPVTTPVVTPAANPPDLPSVLQQLARAIGELGEKKIPPPIPFDGARGREIVTGFFIEFERFATYQHGDSRTSWVKILPNHLRNAPLATALSFGSGPHVSYEEIKHCLITEYSRLRTLDNDALGQLMSLKRRPNEKILDYGIRLRKQARLAFPTDLHNQDVAMKSKIYDAVTVQMRHDLNLRLVERPNAPIDQVIKLASLLEERTNLVNPAQLPAIEPGQVHVCGQDTNNRAQLPPRSSGHQAQGDRQPASGECGHCGRRGHLEEACSRKHSLCFHCNQPGHMVKDCPIKHAARMKKEGAIPKHFPVPAASTTSAPTPAVSATDSRAPGLSERKQYWRDMDEFFPQLPIVCQLCDAPGHVARYCPRYLPSGNDL